MPDMQQVAQNLASIADWEDRTAAIAAALTEAEKRGRRAICRELAALVCPRCAAGIPSRPNDPYYAHQDTGHGTYCYAHQIRRARPEAFEKEG